MVSFDGARVGDTEWAATRVAPGNTVLFLKSDGNAWQAMTTADSFCGTASAGGENHAGHGGTLPRWSWLAVLAVGLGLFELLRRALGATDNPHLALPRGCRREGRDRRVHLRPTAGVQLSEGVLAAVAVTGGVVGVEIASALEYDTVREQGVSSMLGVAMIEMTAKLIVPAAVLVGVRRYPVPAEGLLLGVASGAGFAVLETMGSPIPPWSSTRVTSQRSTACRHCEELPARQCSWPGPVWWLPPSAW